MTHASLTGLTAATHPPFHADGFVEPHGRRTASRAHVGSVCGEYVCILRATPTKSRVKPFLRLTDSGFIHGEGSTGGPE